MLKKNTQLSPRDSGRPVRYDPRRTTAILARLGLDPAEYLQHIRRCGPEYYLVVLGSVARLREVADRVGRRFLKEPAQQ